MSNPENKDAKTNKENSANADSKALDQAQNSNLKNLVVKQGETIEFVLKNTGKVTHEWVFGKENDLVQHAKQMQAAAQHAGHNHGHDDSNKFDHDQGSSIQGARVNALENKSLIITFNETGEFTTACFEAGHFEAGMKGKLSVMPAQWRMSVRV